MNISITLTKYIQRPLTEVYDFISDPENMPKWSLFVRGVERNGETWRATTQLGVVQMHFVPRNQFGVVDHWVQVSSKTRVYVPLRVVANGGGAEVLFTVFRLPEMDDAAWDVDVELVRKDLEHMKQVLEA